MCTHTFMHVYRQLLPKHTHCPFIPGGARGSFRDFSSSSALPG